MRPRGGLEDGARLRAARALLDWSQADLAEAAGVALTTVRRLEKGEAGTRVVVNALIAALAAGGAVIAVSPADLDGLSVEVIVARLRNSGPSQEQ